MAEFCVDCYSRIFEPITKKDVVVTKGLDLCDGCGEYKRVIVRYKTLYVFRMFFKVFNGSDK